MSRAYYITIAFIAVVMFVFGELPVVSSFKHAYDRTTASSIPLRVCRLYSKNRHCDRVKRSRRQHYFFTKRLDQDAIREPAALQRLLSTQRMMMTGIFGFPLSQRLGDGGVMPHLNRTADKVGYVRSYFGIPESETGPVAECCESVAHMPQVTCGEFKGKEPLGARPFYHRPVVNDEDEDFNRAAQFKEGMPPMAPPMSEQDRANRFYSGLLTDIAFTHLPKKDMDELRHIEMQAKQGRFTVSGAAKRRLTDPDDVKEGTTNGEDYVNPDFPFLKGSQL